ncbi:unnamed protein product [Symbiodinium sp. CCMP2592]|nr:unnamed protein product [Symbiodinium sp. CCMP2592]
MGNFTSCCCEAHFCQDEEVLLEDNSTVDKNDSGPVDIEAATVLLGREALSTLRRSPSSKCRPALDWLPEGSQAQVESDKSDKSSKEASVLHSTSSLASVEHRFSEPSMPMQPQLPASAEQPEVHALQEDPDIVRAEVQAAEEGARAAAALQQLQQAAEDGACAQRTLRRHGLRSAASAQSQELQDAVARLRQVTQEPLTQQNVKARGSLLQGERDGSLTAAQETTKDEVKTEELRVQARDALLRASMNGNLEKALRQGKSDKKPQEGAKPAEPAEAMKTAVTPVTKFAKLASVATWLAPNPNKLAQATAAASSEAPRQFAKMPSVGTFLTPNQEKLQGKESVKESTSSASTGTKDAVETVPTGAIAPDPADFEDPEELLELRKRNQSLLAELSSLRVELAAAKKAADEPAAALESHRAKQEVMIASWRHQHVQLEGQVRHLQSLLQYMIHHATELARIVQGDCAQQGKLHHEVAAVMQRIRGLQDELASPAHQQAMQPVSAETPPSRSRLGTIEPTPSTPHSLVQEPVAVAVEETPAMSAQLQVRLSEEVLRTFTEDVSDAPWWVELLCQSAPDVVEGVVAWDVSTPKAADAAGAAHEDRQDLPSPYGQEVLVPRMHVSKVFDGTLAEVLDSEASGSVAPDTGNYPWSEWPEQ